MQYVHKIEEHMPFKSQAQRGYFEANKSKLQSQGVNVNEWAKASKGMKLPKYAKAKRVKQPSVKLSSLLKKY
jgi:hypothetical protein